jgi:hypothetical protein
VKVGKRVKNTPGEGLDMRDLGNEDIAGGGVFRREERFEESGTFPG